MGGHHRQKYKKLKWNSENRNGLLIVYRGLEMKLLKWCLLRDIYTEIILMKYIEQIQARMTISEILRFHTKSFKVIMANCREIRSNMRRFII